MVKDAINRIIDLNRRISNFWSSVHGWAPEEAANLLSKSRLDRQLSLSICLNLWLNRHENDDEEGKLILGWSNLGSLVEGTMKLVLAIYYESYKNDINAIKKNGRLVEPDGLMLESLKKVFNSISWGAKWVLWIEKIQQRRNAIHSFKDRDIGDFTEFYESIKQYAILLFEVNSFLPYPDPVYGMG